jgi:hypothetical protein
MRKRSARSARLVLLCSTSWFLPSAPAHAFTGKKTRTALDEKQFAIEELSPSSPNAPLSEVLDRLPNRGDWENALRGRAAGPDDVVYVNARSGAAVSLHDAIPVIPGDGIGNRLTLPELSQRLGRPVAEVDAVVVADAVMAQVRSRAPVLGIDLAQVGPARAGRAGDHLWHVRAPQQVGGVTVRFAVVSATVSHGNLVGMGTSTWGNVVLDTTPRVTAQEAVAASFEYIEGREEQDVVTEPRLEILPVAPPEHQSGKRFVGPVGQGYRHRLVWILQLERPTEFGRWEFTVDAHSGEVIAFADTAHYAARKRKVTGGVYALTNTDSCADLATCGVMQIGTPMPFADVTSGSGPKRFTNSAGVYDYGGSGVTTTQLRGERLHAISDACGSQITQGSLLEGGLSLGGASGDHDCVTGAPSAGVLASGNTAAARTTFYEVGKISEIGAGWMPDNTYIRGKLPGPPSPSDIFFGFGALTNSNQLVCNGGYLTSPFSGALIGFGRSGSGCRNTGEIAHVIDHEWGHYLDDFDFSGNLNSTAEGYADIAALFRTQQSCGGVGMQVEDIDGCGLSPDGTGANVNEAWPGGTYCTSACSGARDADWVKHVPSLPADPLGFVCTQCADSFTGFGPCGGKRVHCGATPISQAAWDLVARDLQAPPHNFDSQSAFTLGNKLFYQGSDGVEEWYSCECGTSANGCEDTSGYKKWLAADDDNGNLADGTPHMTAIFDAFNRHGIACPTPLPKNSGCAGGPTAVPNVAATPGAFRVTLDWTAVPNATRYRVFRTEGHAGCNYGKALIAEVAGLTHTDTEVAAGRQYFYSVAAVGTNSACFGRLSPCVSATPGTGSFGIACSPGVVTIPPGTGSATTTCTVTSTGGFVGDVDLGCAYLPGGAGCAFTPPTVALAANGAASAVLRVQNVAASPGTYAFKVRGGPPAGITGTHQADLTLAIQSGPAGGANAVFDPTLGVPACALPGSSCDSGPLLRLRDGLGEPNHPNVLGGSCPDGMRSLPTGNGSNDRIVVESTAPFAPGQRVVVRADVEARADFAQDAADFFFAADATHPVWQPIGTAVPTASGPQSLEASYFLPAGSLQAVRVRFRQGAGAPCSANSVDDTDDLVFAVGN